MNEAFWSPVPIQVSSFKVGKTPNSAEHRDLEGYFLRVIWLIPTKETEKMPAMLDVVDGQQRITTICLLLVAMRRCYHQIGDSECAKVQAAYFE